MAAIRSSPGDGRHIDQGRNSDNSQDNVPPWLARQRDDALRTVDRYTRSDHLNAPAADRLDALVRASGTKIDPAGIGARYLAAVGLPAYNSAFGKILADPMHGHLRFSPEEVDVVRVVSAVQTERALNEGTGSAGLLKAAIPARFAASSTFVANPAIWDATYPFMGWMAASLVNMQTETCQRR